MENAKNSSEQLSCPSCGAGVVSGHKFCGQCGSKIARECAECGAENPAGHKFCGSCGKALRSSDAKPEAPPSREERRWATVLFADITGFTSMSERMDAEDVKILASQATERFSQQVSHFGGTVVNVMGDAIMAVFGAPVAHGDDAERAVRAALAMLEIALTDQVDLPLSVHIGVNTGEVMGGLMGPQERRDYTVMGDTVNTASRLESAAPGGAIYVGKETWRATRQAIEYRSVPSIAAKGKTNPVQAWEAVGLAADTSRRRPASGPFLGRDEEMGILLGIWSKVERDAQPHLFTVIAEPGVGKSRLLAEWEEQLPAGVLVCHGGCLAYGEVRGYRALAEALKAASGIAADATADEARKQLAEFVQELSQTQALEIGPVQLARHLALLLGMGSEVKTSELPDLQTLNTSLRYFLEAVARRRPLCLVLEDIHWADEAFLSLIEFVISRANAAPLLIVTSARPELSDLKSDWGAGVRAFTSIDLQPLNEGTTRKLVLDLYRKLDVPAADADRICRATGGNPLFVEEFIASIREKRADIAMPSSIRALITSRLDRLPAVERNVVKVASVVGSVFWPEAVEAAGGIRVSREALDNLVLRDFIRESVPSQIPGQRQYEFKHALVRDAAYEMLPRKERSALHAPLLDWLEQALGDRVGESYDLLAYHAQEAQEKSRALDYLMRAGNRARRAAAYRQAISLYGRAIGLAEEIDETERLAELHALCGRTYSAAGLWADAQPEFEAALERLPEGATAQRAEILSDLATVHHWCFDVGTQRQYAQQALKLSREINRPDLEAAAVGCLAWADSAEGDLESSSRRFREVMRLCGSEPTGTKAGALEIYALGLYWTGKLEQAIQHSRQAIEIGREIGHGVAVVMALPQIGLSLAGLGRYQEALDTFQEVRRFGSEYGISNLLARAIAMSTGVHLELHDYAGARKLAEEARELARSVEFPPPQISANIDLLFISIRTGEIGQAEEMLDGVIAAVAKSAGWHGWLWKMRLAAARAELGLAREDWNGAQKHAEDVLARSRSTGRVKYQSLALQTQARALVGAGKKSEAIPLLQSAVDIVRPLNDPNLLFRAATSYLDVDGSDDLLNEARKIGEQILSALPESDLATSFQQSEAYQKLRE